MVLVGISYFSWKYYEKNQVQMQQKLTFYGNIDTSIVILSSRFLSEIKNIAKDEGEIVEKNENLVFLDASYHENLLQELKTNIKMQETKLKKLQNGFRQEEIQIAKYKTDVALAQKNAAKNTYQRQKKLLSKKATSDENYINSKMDYEAKTANYNLSLANLKLLENGYEKQDIIMQTELINSLKIKLKNIELDIKNSILKSPFDGIIYAKYKEVGSIVTPAQSILEIGKKDDFYVRAYIDEKNLGKIKLGDEMLVFTDLREKPYLAKISFISFEAEFTPKNIQTQELRADLVFEFKAQITNPDEKIKIGLPVHLTLK